MPNPLDREWLPDAERMRATTTWILRREPWLVRIAPVLILVFVVLLGVWTARAQVDVYEGVPIEVVGHRDGLGSDSLYVRLEADAVVPLEVGASVIVVAAGDAPGPSRSRASVVRVQRVDREGVAAVAVTLVAPDGSFSVRSGRATVRVNVGRRPLLAQFLATARSGGSS